MLPIPNDKEHRQVRVAGVKVDGFDPINNIVYEFYGDYWHGNPAIYRPKQRNKAVKKTFGALYKKTMEREEKLRAAGYKIVAIWESDWKQQTKKKGQTR